MTSVLNFFSHIGNYAGIGMIMFILGIIIIIAAVVMLGKLRKTDRGRTVAEFNRQFVTDTHSRISDIESGAERKEIAKKLNIR